MQMNRNLYKILAFVALFPASAAFAQDYSLTNAISGVDIPITMKPAEIPDDFKAVKISQAGAGDAYGLGSMMPTLMAIGAVTNMGAPAEMFLEILPISWTKGQIVNVVGQEYVVTYGIDMGPETLKGMSGSKKLPAFNLRLKLIRTSDIGSLTPLPEWNKAKYLRAMAQVTIQSQIHVAMNKAPASVIPAIPAAPIVTSEPAPIKGAPDVVVTTVPSNPTINISTTPETAVKGQSVARNNVSVYEAAQTNARNLAAAMLLYAQDYDGTFPYVQSTKGAEYVIYPYVKSTGIFQTLNPVRSGEFRFNMCLAGVPMNEITDPTETPLFYDPFAWDNGTYLVAFADSHAKFLSGDEWEILKKNLALKLERKGTPLPADLGLPTAPATAATTPARAKQTP